MDFDEPKWNLPVTAFHIDHWIWNSVEICSVVLRAEQTDWPYHMFILCASCKECIREGLC